MKLSIISPTVNESENVSPLIAAIEAALRGIDYEIIISDDDSPNLTCPGAATRQKDYFTNPAGPLW